MTYRRRDTVPVPFLVSPTGRFDGNDGNWSTFDLKVGSPNQEFRVLVSTSGEISWLPSAAGCVATSESGPLPPNCPDLRGVDSSAAGASLTGYNDTISTSKSPVGTDQIPLNADLTFDEAFGSEYNISATILQDNFQLASGLGSGVQPIQHEAVFAEVTPFDLFTGSLGLGVGNVTNQIKSTPTFLESLVQAGTIPSRSWGYTAGASYSMLLCARHQLISTPLMGRLRRQWWLCW